MSAIPRAFTLLGTAGLGTGDVVGPASATDNAIVRFDGTTGKGIQNSAVTIADTTGAMVWAAGQDASLTAGSSGASLTLRNGANGSADIAGNLNVTGVGSGMGYFVGTVNNQDNIDGLLVETHTGATVNGSYGIFGISSQNTTQNIPIGITDSGSRTGITGDAYSATAAFAGTLASQAGIRGRAGFAAAAASGARTVTNAYGGYFAIQNGAAGATITNAYGLYVDNSETVGTITNRWGVYSAAPNANNYFGGPVGLGRTPGYRLDVVTSASNDRGINVENTSAGSASFGVVATTSGAASTNYAYVAHATGAGTNYSFYGAEGTLYNAQNATIGGNLTVSGTRIVSTDTLSGAGAVSVTKDTTKLTSTGAGQAITLADAIDGTIKHIIHDVDGGSMILTPTTKTGYTTITFTNAGDSVTLEFVTTRGWIVLGSFGVTIA